MSRLEELIQEYCPNGVDYRGLDELGSFFGGLTGKGKDDFGKGSSHFITYMNVFSNIAVNMESTEYVTLMPDEKQNSLQRGDVIFTGSSETRAESGMSSVVTNKPKSDIYLNSFCFGFRFDDCELMNPDFSKHLFRSTKIRNQIIKTANGVTRYNISKKLMDKVKIPLPPLPVQEEIVRILDKFTALEAELEAELEARKKQYEYYRNELLVKNTESSDYEMLTLGDIGKVSMCKRIMKHETNSEGGIPFYKIGTFGRTANAFITKETFEEYRRKYSFPKEGDILISAAGTIGRTVIYDGKPAYFQDSNIVWIDNDESQVLNKYLYYFYETKPWNVASGGTIDRLYNENIRNAKIPLPPLAEQERIVSILDRFDSLVNDITQGLPAEIEARRKQYEYYRNQLLTFKEATP